METAGGRRAGAAGRFEGYRVCIGDLSALGAAALRSRLDDASARTSKASFVHHLSRCASWRVCLQAAR